MNRTLLSTNRSVFLTSTIVVPATTSRIPHHEQALIDAFNTYIQIGIGSLLFLFGLTFNCLSLIYFRVSRSFRHTTFQLYFSIIAILDTVRLLEFLIFILFDKGYLRVSLNLCRIVFFTIMYTGQASIWLTVALAVEKCIIIWFPIKGRLCFTISISKIVLVAILCLVFFANFIYLLPNFFLRTYENVSIHTFMCVWQTVGPSRANKFDEWKKHYFTFNTIFFHSIIPSVLLLVINWLILYSLSRQRVVLSKIGTIDARHVLKRERQFKEKTIQLVLSSFFVIFTISPRYILTMVNAFATNLTAKPLMPLYIYVNLNTVFRVLEMSNYSLNLMFAIMSGRTSRREIRKLLWECLFWRIKRVRDERRGSKLHTHSFLFDDDDDTDRSIATTAGATPYCALTMHSQHRLTYLSRQNSTTNYPPSLGRKSSFFTCCGFKIDLSHKHSIYSSSADITSRRSTICKSSFNNNHNQNGNQNYSPRKSRTYSHSPASLPSYDRSLRNHNTVCLKLIDDNTNNNNHHHSTIRRHSATVVHCFRPLPTMNMNSSTITNSYSQSLRPSISEEKEYSTIETFPQPTSNATVSSTLSPPPIITTTNFDNTNANSTQDTIDSTESIQSHSQDEIHSAYIIETC